MEVNTNETVVDVVAVIIDVRQMMENSAVFQSQVGDQLLALCTLGMNVRLLAVAKDRALFENVAGTRLRAAGVGIELVDDRGFLRNLFGCATALRRMRRMANIRFAYVRGLWGPLVLALASGRRMSYVYDVRGAVGDETSSVGAARIKRAFYDAIENWGIHGAAVVTAVSTPLAELVQSRYGVRVAAVIPCCIDVAALPPAESLRAMRSALGFRDEHIVLVYSGGLSHYQQVPAMLGLWKTLLDDLDLRFLLLTNEAPHSAPAAMGSLRTFGERLVHRKLPRHDVFTALASCDIGFMLRDARELNRVASPVKFPEYLAAGLAVVGSPGTGDVSELIVAHDLGALVDPANIPAGTVALRSLIERVRRERVQSAARARALVSVRYDWAAHAATFRTIYR